MASISQVSNVSSRQYYLQAVTNLEDPLFLGQIYSQHPQQKVGLIDLMKFFNFNLTGSMGWDAIPSTNRTHFEAGRYRLNYRVNANVASPGAGNPGTFALLASQADPTGAYWQARVNDTVMLQRTGARGIVTAVNTGVSPWQVTVLPDNAATDIFGGGLTTTDIFIVTGNKFGEGTAGNTGMTRTLESSINYIQRFKEAHKMTGDLRGGFKTRAKINGSVELWYQRDIDETFERHINNMERALIGNADTAYVTTTTSTYADITARQTMTGIWWFAEQNGLNHPYVAGAMTVNDFYTVQSYIVEQSGETGRYIGFCDNEFLKEFQPMVAALDPMGNAKFTPAEFFNPTGGEYNSAAQNKLALHYNWTCIQVLNVKFCFMRLAMLDNPEEFGATGSPYKGSCLLFPYGLTTVQDGRDSKSLPIMSMMYMSMSGYSRFMNSFGINDLEARARGGESMQSNSFDNQERHFLSHVGTDPKVGNLWIRMYRV